MRINFPRVIVAGATLCISTSSAFAGGWDYNLTTRCISTPWFGQANYYQDDAGCPGALPYAPHWQIGVQSESSLGVSCTGAPGGQTLLINDLYGPVKLGWTWNPSAQNWSVNMVVNQSQNPAPCSGTVWTWFSFQDQTSYLPEAHSLESSHVVYYTHWEPTANDGTRLFAGAHFKWNDKDHFVEVNLNHVNYGYPAAHPYGLLLSHGLADGSDFIILDGAAFNLHVQEGVQTQLYIPWWYLIQVASWNGWFSSPLPTTYDVATKTVHLGVEVKDRAIANLWHTSFRIAP